MNNIINYLNSNLVLPEEVRIQINNILPDDAKHQAVRVAQLTIPFFCLYRPIGSAVALGVGSVRVVVHLTNAAYSAKEGKWTEASKEVVQTSIAVFLVCSTYFEFRIGLFLTNGCDVVTGTGNVIFLLLDKQYSKAGEEAFQTLSTALYLSFMLTGTLEYMLAMLMVQAALELYRACGDISEDRLPEAAAHLAMWTVRNYQIHKCCEQIVERDLVLALENCYALYERAMKARECSDLIFDDIADFDQETVILKAPDGTDYNFGNYFHEYGKGLVKGGNLEFRQVEIDGKIHYELDFKVNIVHRLAIENIISNMKTMNSADIKSVLLLANANATHITVSDTRFPIGYAELGFAHDIHVEGLGKVIIGNDSSYPNLYSRIIVRMDENKNIFDFNEILTLTGLDAAVHRSTAEDIERLKIGHLYRVFFPRDASSYERTDEFFALPIDQLKEKILKHTPEMDLVMDKYLRAMQKYEILPGKVRYQICGLADELKASGACFLTSAVTGTYFRDHLFQRTASVLTMGLLSNETRSSHGLVVGGSSNSQDFMTGGADSVYTQLITDKYMNNNVYDFQRLFYSSDVRFIIDLKAIETGTYQYLTDSYGTRRVDETTYFDRPGITEFLEKHNESLSTNSFWNSVAGGNEVMIKERLPPEFIRGIVVRSEFMKTDLIDYLRDLKIFQIDAGGKECFNNIAIDNFITVDGYSMHI